MPCTAFLTCCKMPCWHAAFVSYSWPAVAVDVGSLPLYYVHGITGIFPYVSCRHLAVSFERDVSNTLCSDRTRTKEVTTQSKFANNFAAASPMHHPVGVQLPILPPSQHPLRLTPAGSFQWVMREFFNRSTPLCGICAICSCCAPK